MSLILIAILLAWALGGGSQTGKTNLSASAIAAAFGSGGAGKQSGTAATINASVAAAKATPTVVSAMRNALSGDAARGASAGSQVAPLSAAKDDNGTYQYGGGNDTFVPSYDYTPSTPDVPVGGGSDSLATAYVPSDSETIVNPEEADWSGE